MKSEIGQHLFIGLAGKSLSSDEKKFIVANNIGGITLFGRNLESPEQIRELCNEIQALRHKMPDKAPIFIGIDMEGGRVHRLKPPYTQWPALQKLGSLDSPKASFNFGYYMGLELKASGINLDYAPCVDVFTNPKNTVIGDRALSTDPEIVARHASALIRGYMKAEVIPCAKHFPGHGDTVLDSHLDLPIEQATLQQLQDRELIPFKKSLRSRLKLMMTAHIRFPNIDQEWPVTLSEIFIQDLIRKDFRYKGFLITDDLGMKALAAHYSTEEIAIRALHVGMDFLLYCNEPDCPPIAVNAIEKALKDGKLSLIKTQTNHKRILDWKKECIKNPEASSAQVLKNIIGCSAHLHLAKGVLDGDIPTDLGDDE